MPEDLTLYKIDEILKNKNIPKHFFENNENLTINSSINEHVKKAYQIFKIPYPSKNKEKRFLHGVTHASRVSFYIRVLASLYKRYNPGADFPEDDLKLLEISALFHDIGREGDDEDIWEIDSATILYYYLNKTLGIAHKQSKFLCQLIVNKDYRYSGIYYKVTDINNDGLVWGKETNSSEKMNFHQALLHDADCLDIARARSRFDANYLFFFEFCVKNKIDRSSQKLPRSMLEMGQLIFEVKSLLEHCGETYYFPDHGAIDFYNSEDCYLKITNCVNKNHFPIMQFLLNNSSYVILNIDRIDGVSYRQPQDKLDVFRGVRIPSAIETSFSRFESPVTANAFGNQPTNANNELSLAFRKEGVLTETQNGNALRSVSILEKSGLYSAAGFLCSNKSIDSFSNIYTNGNAVTGVGEKFIEPDSKEKKMADLYELMVNQSMGGVVYNHYWSHTELLISEINPDGIVFTDDPTMSNYMINNKKIRYNSGVPFLEAIYLHSAYAINVGRSHESIYNNYERKLNLPIYKYSGLHSNPLEEISFPSNDEILKIWKVLIRNYFKKARILQEKIDYNDSSYIEDLKVRVCYEINSITIYNQNFNITSLDAYYSNELKQAINKEIELEVEIYKLAESYFNDHSEYLRLKNSLIKNLELLIKQEITNSNFERKILLPKILEQKALQIFSEIKEKSNTVKFLAYDILNILGLLKPDDFRKLKNNKYCYRVDDNYSKLFIGEPGLAIFDYSKNQFLLNISECSMGMVSHGLFLALRKVSNDIFVNDLTLNELFMTFKMKAKDNSSLKEFYLYSRLLFDRDIVIDAEYENLTIEHKNPNTREEIKQIIDFNILYQKIKNESSDYKKIDLIIARLNFMFKNRGYFGYLETQILLNFITPDLRFNSKHDWLNNVVKLLIRFPDNLTLLDKIREIVEKNSEKLINTDSQTVKILIDSIFEFYLYDDFLEVVSLIADKISERTFRLYIEGYNNEKQSILSYLNNLLNLHKYSSMSLRVIKKFIEYSPRELWYTVSPQTGNTHLADLLMIINLRQNDEVLEILKIAIQRAEFKSWDVISIDKDNKTFPIRNFIELFEVNLTNNSFVELGKLLHTKLTVEKETHDFSCEFDYELSRIGNLIATLKGSDKTEASYPENISYGVRGIKSLRK